jgi:hypothetical protein
MRVLIISFFAIMAGSLLFNGFDAGKSMQPTGVNDVATPGFL